MSKNSQAILLLADISGYTKFMKMHTVSVNHAKQIIVRLLKSLIKSSKTPLKVAELEGDAIFFYAPTSENNISKTAELVKSQLIRLFAAFKNELDILTKMKVCMCEACRKAGELKLKQVIHFGDVEFEKIQKSEKLFGLDVIVVHRMLKNTVPSHEYVMMTEPIYTKIAGFYGLEPERRKENFEGIGEINTIVFYPEKIISNSDYSQGTGTKPSFKERVGWAAKLIPRTFLNLLGISKVKGTFNNIPT